MSRKLRLLSVLVLGLFLVLAASTATAEQRTGAWLDEIIFSEDPVAEAVITRMQAGEIDVFASGRTEVELFELVLADPNLDYETSFGSYAELTFNPHGPLFNDGRLNPFAVHEIREAMNWLIDREYIAQELYGGLAIPKYFPITGAFPDYARYIDIARALEAKYSHDPRRAQTVIAEQMRELGAEIRAGVWHYDGEPVEIIALIRPEDERRDVGDYVADLLEGIGFKVRRDYRTGAEASPIWLFGTPAEGLFHVYTGGWITTVVSRDQASNFYFFYTPGGWATPLNMAMQPTDEFYEVAERLNRRDFTTMEGREELFVQALELAMKDSQRVWTVDTISFSPRLANVSVGADLAGAIAGSYMYPFTIRWADEIGGSMNVAQPQIFVDPWNPLDGSNWIFDMMPIRGTADWPTIYDPFTGLHWPQRLKHAEVTMKEGFPVSKTLDWVDLDFVEEIVVPRDAYIDWDPVDQVFITIDEKYDNDEIITANKRVVIHFEEDLFDRKMHDGSTFDMADLLMPMILTFDRANEKSVYFDEAQVPPFETFKGHFRGFRIISTDPVVIEGYTDGWYMDAELGAAFFAGAWAFWPWYAQGPGPWHMLVPGLMAEAAGESAFSSAKADKEDVEWLNYAAGPTVEVLRRQTERAIEEAFIPYEATLGNYISAEDAVAKYQNLMNWYNEKGHFWVSFGPYYLERAFPVEKVVQLRRFEDYPDPADKWEIFEEPALADVDVTGPRRVPRGTEATFDVIVELFGEPYPVEFIANVVYLAFGPDGSLLFSGEAEAVEDGLWRFKLSAEDTEKLLVGVNKIEVAVTSVLTAIPSFDYIEFVAH